MTGGVFVEGGGAATGAGIGAGVDVVTGGVTAGCCWVAMGFEASAVCWGAAGVFVWTAPDEGLRGLGAVEGASFVAAGGGAGLSLGLRKKYIKARTTTSTLRIPTRTLSIVERPLCFSGARPFVPLEPLTLRRHDRTHPIPQPLLQ